MKKALKITVVIVLLGGAVTFLFRDPIKEAAIARLTDNMFVTQDNDDFDPGPVTGSRFPGLRARYGDRQVTLLEEFEGDNGTVLVASRSLDWCPYCRRQMIQLQEYKAEFDDAGIGLVAITYDEPRLQRAFIDRYGITIPVLSDIDGLSFSTLGILNQQYHSGDPQYGIPHPGMIVVNPAGEVVGKLFIEAYSSRVDSAAALAFARQALGLDRARTDR